VLFTGSLRTPEGRLRDDIGEAGHQTDRDDDDNALDIRQLNGKPAMFRQLVPALDDRLQRLDPRTLGELDVILQNDRYADGGDQRGKPEGSAERTVGAAFDHPAIHAGNEHSKQQHENEGEYGQGEAGARNKPYRDD